jgi:hypothetical protein
VVVSWAVVALLRQEDEQHGGAAGGQRDLLLALLLLTGGAGRGCAWGGHHTPPVALAPRVLLTRRRAFILCAPASMAGAWLMPPSGRVKRCGEASVARHLRLLAVVLMRRREPERVVEHPPGGAHEQSVHLSGPAAP